MLSSKGGGGQLEIVSAYGLGLASSLDALNDGMRSYL